MHDVQWNIVPRLHGGSSMQKIRRFNTLGDMVIWHNPITSKIKKKEQHKHETNDFTKGVYYIGIMKWSKGCKELLKLLGDHNNKTKKYAKQATSRHNNIELHLAAERGDVVVVKED